MLVIVIVLFAVCWGPTLIDNVLRSFNLVEKLNYGHLKHLRQVRRVAFCAQNETNSKPSSA